MAQYPPAQEFIDTIQSFQTSIDEIKQAYNNLVNATSTAEGLNVTARNTVLQHQQIINDINTKVAQIQTAMQTNATMQGQYNQNDQYNTLKRIQNTHLLPKMEPTLKHLLWESHTGGMFVDGAVQQNDCFPNIF